MKKIDDTIINDIVNAINANPDELGLTKTTNLKKKVDILLEAVSNFQYKQFEIIDDYIYKKEIALKLFDSSERQNVLDLIDHGISLLYEAIECTGKMISYLSSQYINLNN